MTELYFDDGVCRLLLGDALKVLRSLPDESVDCVVTSPPYYGLRSYLPDVMVLRADLTPEELSHVRLAFAPALGQIREPWAHYSKSHLPASVLDYFKPAEYGAEKTPAEYVETMRRVFAEAKRVLTADGTLWLNLGDTYNNRTRGQWRGSSDGFTGRAASPRWQRQTAIPEKSMVGIPWRVAFALQDDGWSLRNDIVWHKPNAMPESVTDRLATRYEHVFLLTKSRRYWFDLDAIREAPAKPDQGRSWAERRSAGAPKRHGLAGAAVAKDSDFGAHESGRNPGDVWTISSRPYPGAHFATFPPELPNRCIRAGCRPGGAVLDPFSGSGTTGLAARLLGRSYIGIDLNAAYHDLAIKRFRQGVLVPEVSA